MERTIFASVLKGIEYSATGRHLDVSGVGHLIVQLIQIVPNTQHKAQSLLMAALKDVLVHSVGGKMRANAKKVCTKLH